ncbi:MAG TPA: transposase [Thermoanaerobaculia bacterium]|nr:transposase [Thermoanaerobaculia bacterium]
MQRARESEIANKSDRIDGDDLSERLRLGSLKAVYHGAPSVLTLKELVRNYNSLVEDAMRVMLRIKALFRARAIATSGTSVYRAGRRQEWLDQLTTAGARVRAACLLEQLDLLLKLRPKAKAAMITAEARKQRGWRWLRSIPFFGNVRTAQLLAIMATPYRFGTKRSLWPYAGLAVVTQSSSDQELSGGKLRRRARAPRTRGLNRDTRCSSRSSKGRPPPQQQRKDRSRTSTMRAWPVAPSRNWPKSRWPARSPRLPYDSGRKQSSGIQQN